jgi:hypothetical protein
MILKSIDLSLMAEHLMTHKGLLNKLEAFYCTVQENTLKQIIYEQYLLMRNHVKVMISLMDPEQNEKITVSSLNQIDPVEIQCPKENLLMNEQTVALELRNTAKTMAHDNFSSALRMKAPNVRNIHIHMALQQTVLQDRYNHFIKEKMWEVTPESLLQQQKDTLQSFKAVFHIDD